VKVGQDPNWIDPYREVVEAKSALKEMTGVRKTKAGHILIELTNKVAAGEVADNLKRVMRQGKEIVPLANREALEINIRFTGVLYIHISTNTRQIDG
jgi:hypothetical protein